MTYTEQVWISKVELEMIRDWRRLQEHGRGHLHLYCENHIMSGSYIQLNKDTDKLRALQG